MQGQRIITATRETLGTASLRNSSRLPLKSRAWEAGPVRFPPGRARLATSPVTTGSELLIDTMGIVVVAFLAAWLAGVRVATMMSTGSRTKSPASSGSRSNLPSAHRYSMTRFWPSTQPNSCSPCADAERATGLAEHTVTE